MTTTMVREDEAAAASLTAADWSAGAIVLTVTLGAGAYATCGANGARLAIRTGSSSFSPIKAMVADSALYLAAFLSASTLIGLPNLASFHATHSFAAYFLSLALPSAGAFLGAAAIAASIFAPVLAASTTVKVKDKNLKAASTDNDRGWLRYLRLRFESTFLLGLMRAIFALMWLIYAASLLSTLASILRSSASSLDPTASVIIIIVIGVLFTAVEGKSFLIWNDFVLGVLAVVGLLGLAGASNNSNNSNNNLVYQAPETEPEKSDSFFGLFVGQTFVWLCVFLTTFSADDRLGLSPNKRSSAASIFVRLALPAIPAVLLVFPSVAAVASAISGRFDGDRRDCDAYNGGSTVWPDQALPTVLIQRYSSTLPGFSGLILACLFAHTLSLISSGLNSLTRRAWRLKPIDQSPDGCFGVVGDDSAAAAEVAGSEDDEDDIEKQGLNGNGTAAQHQRMRRRSRRHSAAAARRKLDFARLAAARVTAAVFCIFAGLFVFIIRHRLTYAVVVGLAAVPASVLIAVLFLGLFFPYANGRGVILGSLISLMFGLWISLGGVFYHRDSASAPFLTLAAETCEHRLYTFTSGGGVLGNGIGVGGKSIADSPHLPTGPQAAGKNQPKKEDAPFHVPTRKKDSQQQHHQQQQQQQQYQQQQGPGGDVAAGGNGEKFLPRSPMSDGGKMSGDSRSKENKKKKRRRKKRNSGSTGVSPHKTAAGSGGGTSSNQRTGSIMPPGISGGSGSGISGNRPPLVLANPNAQNEGNGGYEAGRAPKLAIFYLPFHYYGLLCFACTIVLSLLFSLRPPARGLKSCVEDEDDDHDQDHDENTAAKSTSDVDNVVMDPNTRRLSMMMRNQTMAPLKPPSRISLLDANLLHPIARGICCRCCRERKMKPSLHFSMEQHRARMTSAAAIISSTLIEGDPTGAGAAAAALSASHHSRHYRQGSNHSRRSSGNNGVYHGEDDGGLSRRYSRYSHVSKRSSLASSQGTQQQQQQQQQQPLTTTAEVIMSQSGSSPALRNAVHQQLGPQRRPSQLSSEHDPEVEAAVLSRRNSGSSSGYPRSPKMSLAVPPGSGKMSSSSSPSASAAGGTAQQPENRQHLAPPTESELQAQRRFSEVNAAIERHNSRRAAKQRSQSVYYRHGRSNAGASRQLSMSSRRSADMMGSGAAPSIDLAPVDFDPLNSGGRRRSVRNSGLKPPQQQLHATYSAPLPPPPHLQ